MTGDRVAWARPCLCCAVRVGIGMIF